MSSAAPESKEKKVAADLLMAIQPTARIRSPPENEGKLAASQAAHPAAPSGRGHQDGISQVNISLYPTFQEKMSEASREAPRKAAPTPKEVAPQFAPKKSAAKAVSPAAPKGKKEKVALLQHVRLAQEEGDELTEYK